MNVKGYMKGIGLMLQGRGYMKGIGLMLQSQSYQKGNGGIQALAMVQSRKGLLFCLVDQNGAGRGPKAVMLILRGPVKVMKGNKYPGLQVWIVGRLRSAGPL